MGVDDELSEDEEMVFREHFARRMADCLVSYKGFPIIGAVKEAMKAEAVDELEKIKADIKKGCTDNMISTTRTWTCSQRGDVNNTDCYNCWNKMTENYRRASDIMAQCRPECKDENFIPKQIKEEL